ncbi:NDR1/HIN1-like protein 3 [Iris pallida]|uniref:NDR1/HIN1-like protein 3 n=1 Tax=Iris pallida TaxID=29817 RepID=A0AAX6DFH1_IRIPA|nr:NDR1/HIN1-like protein 3 [Iris pallida]
MADPKQQVQLNGAYYGPPVPPRDNTYRSAGRRGSDCGCGCLLAALLKLIISVVVSVGVIILVLWLLFRPQRVQVHVESATLTQFNLTNTTNALAYNLTMDVSIRNPNRRVAFYWDRIEARAIYDGYRFGYDALPAFYQGHRTTTTLHPAFRGQQAAPGSVAGTFEREKGEGSFYVQVELSTKLRIKVLRFVKLGHFKPRKIDCVVKLPVPGSTGSFERTKCHVDWF